MIFQSYKGLVRDGDKFFLVLDSGIVDGKELLFWDFPGGKPNDGETPKNTVVREVKEETNMDVEVGELIGKYRIDSFDGKIVNCDVYECTPITKDVDTTQNPAPNENILKVAWVSRNEALKLEHLPKCMRDFIITLEAEE